MNAFRDNVDRIGLALPLPNVNPNIVSGMSVLTSMLFVLSFSISMEISLAFLTITVLFDWFDGLIAKKFSRSSEGGYFVDLMSDRLSEGIMFSVFFFPWFHLFSLNCFLSILSVVKKKHVILPIRHIFLIYLIYLYISPMI